MNKIKINGNQFFINSEAANSLESYLDDDCAGSIEVKDVLSDLMAGMVQDGGQHEPEKQKQIMHLADVILLFKYLINS